MEENQTFRSGFVSVIGKPNVGKSTLMNRLLRQKVAAVSPRPQTTQRNQLGIITEKEYQIIFIDTPGIHRPQSKLGEYMNDAATGTFTDVDIVLWIVNLNESPSEEDKLVARRLNKSGVSGNTILALNKKDLLKASEIEAAAKAYLELLPDAESFIISAANGSGCDALFQFLVAKLPPGPAFYSEDQVTDLYEREIARDLIRESLLNNLEDEIPHTIAVRIDEYKDRTPTKAYIMATLFLDREAHKSIVIGKNGSMIKKIGQDARIEIEKMTGRSVYLELKVKVVKNWLNNPTILKSLGFFQKSN